MPDTTFDDRVWHHEMETCEGIREHAERIATMEELLIEVLEGVEARCGGTLECQTCPISDPFGTGDCMTAHVRGRMVALGVIPDEGLAS